MDGRRPLERGSQVGAMVVERHGADPRCAAQRGLERARPRMRIQVPGAHLVSRPKEPRQHVPHEFPTLNRQPRVVATEPLSTFELHEPAATSSRSASKASATRSASTGLRQCRHRPRVPSAANAGTRTTPDQQEHSRLAASRSHHRSPQPERCTPGRSSPSVRRTSAGSVTVPRPPTLTVKISLCAGSVSDNQKIRITAE